MKRAVLVSAASLLLSLSLSSVGGVARADEPAAREIFLPPPPVENIDQPPTPRHLVRKHPGVLAGGVVALVGGAALFVGSMFAFVTYKTDQSLYCNSVLAGDGFKNDCRAWDQRAITISSVGLAVGALAMVASVPLLVIGSEKHEAPRPLPVAKLGAGSVELAWHF